MKKIKWTVRQYVKGELMDYATNKRLLKEIKDTRSLLLAKKRIEQIDRVFNNLNEEDRKGAELIFVKHYSQERAEIEGYSKKAYYNLQNKVIYLTAYEMELI